jgi:hypothetical protein
MGSGSKAPVILTSELDGVEWSVSRPYSCSPGETTALSTLLVGGHSRSARYV